MKVKHKYGGDQRANQPNHQCIGKENFILQGLRFIEQVQSCDISININAK